MKKEMTLNNSTQAALFTPFTINNLSLPNRIVMAPMTRGKSPQNIPTPEIAQYYRRRVDGGVGLIITECTFIKHPVANGISNAPAFHGEQALLGWLHVVEEVHDAGGKIIPQIWHSGSSRSIGIKPNETMLSIGPTDKFKNGRQVVKGMNETDIFEVIHAFTQAAVEAQLLGFDGVEIHGAHSYLIDQFLWSESNSRTDEYGGSISNRVKLASKIVESIRSAVGKDFPIFFRFSQWKLTNYNAKIVRNPVELEQMLLPLVKAGVDVFHVSTRRFWLPAFEGSELSLAAWTKTITGKPVIAVGSVGIDKEFSLDMFTGNIQSQPKAIDLVEDKLKTGDFDLIAVGRAILADANWPNKIKLNQLDEILNFSSKSLASLD
ncbi:MAG: NADH:flavin oxidoreductase [Verrucomicrobiales bacterium]|nr:NADH:flavin oxidoreductase [Verrucomicrobiales bacterium]